MDQTKEWPIKIRRVTVTDKKTGTKYVEERQYQYDPIKKHNRVISSRRVGEKILKDSTEVVRCRPKKKSLSASSELEAVRARSGATDLLSYVGKISGIDAAVRAAYPNGGTGEKLLSVAQYLVASGETVHNIEAWQCEDIDMPNFCKELVLKKVCVVPGNAFLTDENETCHSFRINFSTPTDEQLERGIKILGEYANSL